MTAALIPGSWSNHSFLRYLITLLVLWVYRPSFILHRAKEARIKIQRNGLLPQDKDDALIGAFDKLRRLNNSEN